MLSFSQEQNEGFVIFGVAQERYAEVVKVVNGLPHKWVMGSFNGQLELSCLMPLNIFLPVETFLMKGEKCYLKLGPADAKTNARTASLSFNKNEGYSGKESNPIGRFVKVNEPSAGEDFTFDPETGYFFEVIENAR